MLTKPSISHRCMKRRLLGRSLQKHMQQLRQRQWRLQQRMQTRTVQAAARHERRRRAQTRLGSVQISARGRYGRCAI